MRSEVVVDNRKVYIWECPICGQEWPSFSEQMPISYTVCPPCTYAKAAEIARQYGDLARKERAMARILQLHHIDTGDI